VNIKKSVINAFKQLLTFLFLPHTPLSCQNDSELEKNAKKVEKHFPKSAMNAEAAAAAARDEIQTTNNSKRV
jgi:hypothetical protein